MNQILEIVSRPKSSKEIRIEFERFIERAQKEHWNELKVLFGFAWGNYIYEGDWTEEIMSPNKLARKVREAEENEDGEIGSDDLIVTPVGLGVEHIFCHEADIHLEGSLDSEYIQREK